MANKYAIVVILIQLASICEGRPAENIENGSNCVDSCASMQDGDYQSCDECHVFVTCSSGMMLKNACPPGQLWDDNSKTCEMMSATCQLDDTVAFMGLKNGMDRVDDYSQLPDNFNLKFNVRDADMRLNLTRNDHFNADFPIYMANQGVITKVDMPVEDMFAIYGDKSTSASIIVQRNPEQQDGPDYVYEGMFSMDEGEYFLQPTPVSTSNSSNDILGGPYMVRKIELTDPDMPFGDSELRRDVSELTRAQESVLDRAQDSQRLPRGLQRYQVEVLLFLDYAIYNKWYRLSKKRTSAEREAEAVRNIRFYYSHIMNGVDMRYNSIEDTSMEIYFKLNAMYIAKTGRDSPWTEYNRRDIYFTEAYDSLDDFEAWLNKTRYSLPPFDLAALLTGYNLYNGQRSDGSLRTIGGLADIKGACTYSPVWFGASISHENGLFGTTQTVTHEMGHNLGAYHDGDRRYAVECRGSDQYIMASAPGGITDANYKNGLQFSHCSIRNIRDYLLYLTMEEKNCLLETASYPTDRVNTGNLPGQVFLPDEQCQIIYGTSSYYCGGAPNDRSICREMWCFSTNTKRCVFTSEQRAFEGTTCGNKEWCEKNDCVFNQRAPEAPESCIYGDYKDPYQPSGKTCPEVIAERPWNCYREDYGSECCESCGNIRDDTRPGCEFGDRSQCSDRESWHCYDQNTRDDCCLFCDAFYNKDAAIGCEYGNRGRQCDDIEDFHCYNQDQTCCATCAQRERETYTPGCQYGDKQRWCRDIRSSHQCYNGNDDICCETCSQFKTNDPACPYGDRNQFCRRDHCTSHQYNTSCCYTCRRTRDITPVPTVPTDRPHVSQPSSGCQDRPTWNCAALNPWDCYSQHEACCATCEPRHKDNQPGCEFGDKISWCASYVRENTPEKVCQSEFVRRECCESCSAMPALTTTTPDTIDSCPQGNKADWCVARSFFGGYCYSDQTRDTCCLACSRVRNGPPGCEYGDKASWCSNFVSGDMAQACQRRDVKQQCCMSCMGLGGSGQVGTTPSMAVVTTRTPVIGNCPEGDTADWCVKDVARNPGICYKSSTRTTCCLSCAQHRTTDPDCPYGDEFSWCRPEHCERDEYHRRRCCHTCRN